MEILALCILVSSILIGFAAIFFTTFGTFIILAGALFYSFLTDFAFLGLKPLLVIFTLYLIGEVLEYVLIIVGAKKLGASNMAVVGALIGGILGAVAGSAMFGVGLILGTFLGIFFGAFLVEFIIQRDLIKSLKAGAGGVLGRAGSIAVKLILAIIMVSIIVYQIFILS